MLDIDWSIQWRLWSVCAVAVLLILGFFWRNQLRLWSDLHTHIAFLYLSKLYLIKKTKQTNLSSENQWRSACISVQYGKSHQCFHEAWSPKKPLTDSKSSDQSGLSKLKSFVIFRFLFNHCYQCSLSYTNTNTVNGFTMKSLFYFFSSPLWTPL